MEHVCNYGEAVYSVKLESTVHNLSCCFATTSNPVKSFTKCVLIDMLFVSYDPYHAHTCIVNVKYERI